MTAPDAPPDAAADRDRQVVSVREAQDHIATDMERAVELVG